MFKVGDYIVCGHNGVCKVEKIGTLEASSSDRMFYTLTPVDDRNAQIFTPVDNNKMIMRYVMTKDEALDLIDSSEIARRFSDSVGKEERRGLQENSKEL